MEVNDINNSTIFIQNKNDEKIIINTNDNDTIKIIKYKI